MENVLLIIHLILALGLIGIVLLQRSEGGGLGMGSSGGGGGGVMTGRQAATALGRLTWGLAVAFIATSLTLTILAAQDAATSSVVDRVGGEAPASGSAPAGEEGGQTGPAAPEGNDLLPPAQGSDDAPAAPPRAD